MVRLLGEGAMGAVYLYRDAMDRLVAVKRLHVVDEEQGRRLLREAQALARLEHAHVVRVYSIHPEETSIVMEYVDGSTVKDLAAGHLPQERAIRLAWQAAGALAYMHERGVIHRDVKPSNMLVSRCGDLKMADFGLARFVDPGMTITRPWIILGTPGYAAPEQMAHSEVGCTADIYSLGCVMYFMVAKRNPFEFTGSIARLRTDQEAGPPIPATLPPAIRQIISRATAFRPEERYPSASDMEADLAGLDADEISRASAPNDTTDVQAAATAGVEPPSQGDPTPDDSPFDYLRLPSPIMRDLASPAREVRRTGIAEVVRRRMSDAIPLLEMLAARDPDNQLRLMADRAVNFLRESSLMPPRRPALDAEAHELVLALKDTVPAARAFAVTSLGRRRDPALLKHLLPLAALERDPAVKGSLAIAMASCADITHRHRVLEILVKRFLEDPVPVVRSRALEALGVLSGREATEAVVLCLRDPDASCRSAAERVLHGLGSEVVLATARSLLLSPLVSHRDAAVCALQLSGDVEAVHLLRRALQDTFGDIVGKAERALQALAAGGIKEAQRELAARVNRPGPSTTPVLSPPKPGDAAGPLTSTDPNERLRAVVEIGALGLESRAINLLELLAREADAFVQAAILTALGRLRAADAAEAILGFLDSTDGRVRASAVEALASLRRADLLYRLRPHLDDPDSRARANAVVALAAQPGVDIVATLREMLASADTKMKRSARWAIKSIGDPALETALGLSPRPAGLPETRE